MNNSNKNHNINNNNNTNSKNKNLTCNGTSNFGKGSLIELSTGELKRVEDMRTEDFVISSSKNPNLQLIDTTVVKVTPQSKNMVVITLSYNNNNKVNILQFNSFKNTAAISIHLLLLVWVMASIKIIISKNGELIIIIKILLLKKLMLQVPRTFSITTRLNNFEYCQWNTWEYSDIL